MQAEKYIYIKTFGCQMNVHDSEQIETLLAGEGYGKTDDVTKADVIIVNTCSIRAKAQQKVYSMLGRYRRLKLLNPGLIIAVGGCLAQHLGTELLKKIPYLDIVFGTHNIHRLPDMIGQVKDRGNRIVEISFHELVQSLAIRTVPTNGSISTYVTIMQGCNNYCSYCVVPYLRGREESRKSEDIIDEITFLTDHGIKEITLLGQNVNSYGTTVHNGSNFSALLREIGDIKGIERIRYTTSHPKDLSDELVRCYGSVTQLCEHIHLPVQSGSDEILKRMNRKYKVYDYLGKVDKLREACPDINITTDIIVGFPGESDRDFQKTIDLMEKVRFDNAFSFMYSCRRGTVAERFTDDEIPDSVKGERLSILQSLQEHHALESNKSRVGNVEEVLVEGYSKNNRTDITGRTRTNKIVNFKGPVAMVGKTVSVKIIEAYTHSLRGELLLQKGA